MTTYTEILTFVTVTCYKCGVPFGLHTRMERELRENGASFFCPNGHSQAYCESDVRRLQKQLDKQKADTEWYRQQSQARADARDRAKRQTRAYKGVITKTKNRIAHGVCPCCQRTFQNLARHMKGQHPDYAESVNA